jgi:hypothetical protein
VKRIAEAQRDASVRVGATDEIKLINAWQPSPYVSISINLNGLPIFK